MTAVATKQAPPKDEQEVINRLKINPHRVLMSASVDVQAHAHSPRYSFKIQHRFNDPIRHFGKFLEDVTIDVYRAGGVVTNIETASDLRPQNERPDDFTPTSKWSCLHVNFAIRVRDQVEQEAAGFDESIKNLFRETRKTK